MRKKSIPAERIKRMNMRMEAYSASQPKSKIMSKEKWLQIVAKER